SLFVPLVPSPTWPYWFQPHAQTVPSDSIARLWSRPPAMATTFARLCTCTGVVWLVVLPIPRLPNSLSPQAHTEPPASRASVWSRAPAIGITFVSPATATGDVLLPPEPFPSCPNWSFPIEETVPVVTACAAPTEAISKTENTETSNTPARRSRLTPPIIGHVGDVVES